MVERLRRLAVSAFKDRFERRLADRFTLGLAVWIAALAAVGLDQLSALIEQPAHMRSRPERSRAPSQGLSLPVLLDLTACARLSPCSCTLTAAWHV